MKDDAYQNGYFNGATRENPYPPNTEEHKNFESGKRDAMIDLEQSVCHCCHH